MSKIVLSVESVSKQYRLGQTGTGMLMHDVNRWVHRIRGKEDPYKKLSVVNDRTKVSDSKYVWAIRDISFDVSQGEVLAIIGKNGSGKSTLLKILSRITSPTEGVVKMRGRLGSLLEVGTGMHPELTGKENIFLNGAILGMTKTEISRKFDDIVDFSGCARYIDTPVKRYSSGMIVRMGFAVAAFLEPEILIIDEVLAVGDAEFQLKAIDKMKQVAETEGRTVLFVSHNMTAVQSLCTRGILLNNGALTYTGSAEDCVKEYGDANYHEVRESAVAVRPDVIKTGRIEVSDFWFENREGERKFIFMSGDSIQMKLNYKSSLDELPFLSVSFALHDANGSPLAELWNFSVEGAEKVYPPSGTITCSINSLPLNAGRYYINITIRHRNQMDYLLKHAAYFDVLQSDFYGQGFMPNPKFGQFLLEQNWSTT
ncbi:MAG: ABC transporter ATP-binding protein [Flavobacteriales bacterium]|nr:ABC transporter ATP-binding protein [Flavobacteriales bacterium]